MFRTGVQFFLPTIFLPYGLLNLYCTVIQKNKNSAYNNSISCFLGIFENFSNSNTFKKNQAQNLISFILFTSSANVGKTWSTKSEEKTGEKYKRLKIPCVGIQSEYWHEGSDLLLLVSPVILAHDVINAGSGSHTGSYA